MTTTGTVYTARRQEDAYGETYVRYWSVTEQRWRRIYHATGCSDADYTALQQHDRALIDALPVPKY